MIVLGADMHKSSHSIVAVDAATGQLTGEKTVAVGARGFGALVVWAGGLAGERVWALEDCRHVCGALERFLISRGERVVGVSTRLMATSRRSARERGKSDRIDALAVARAVLAEGVETCRRRRSPVRSSTSACWSIIASGSSASGSGSTTRWIPTARVLRSNGSRRCLFPRLATVRRRWPAAATELLRFVHCRRRVAPTSDGSEATGEMRLRPPGSLGLLGDQRGWPGPAWSHSARLVQAPGAQPPLHASRHRHGTQDRRCDGHP